MSGLGWSMRAAVARRDLRGWAPSVLGLALCVVASVAWSQEAVYQGRLTDDSGTALTGLVDLELRIYNDLTAGQSLYEEFHLNVELSDEGVFSVPLGGGTDQVMTYDASLFPGTAPRYLEVWVDEELLSPRQRIGTVPTALVAEEWVGDAAVTNAQNAADSAQGTADTAVTNAAAAQSTADTAQSTASANTNGLSNQSSELAALQAQVAELQTSLCGNGVVNPGIETCDDGNTTDDGNGCTASCQANNVCGNGIIESLYETCDDGGTANGDGCSDSCSIEQGFGCNGEPSVCSALRFEPCTDGVTVADNETGLLWERKTTTGDVHDVANIYTWSIIFTGANANGTAYTVFLASLNAASFAGHTNWRLPIISELQSILVGPGVTTVANASPADPASGTNPTGQSTTCGVVPCIDPDFAAVGGPTASSFYWSASSDATFPTNAWFAFFGTGVVLGNGNKTLDYPVRAVRAGSCTN